MSTDRTRRAQEVVAAQVGCTIDEALRIIEGLARDTDESVSFVVDELLAGHVSLSTAAV